MVERGKVRGIGPIIPEGNEPGVSKNLDLNMLVLQGGGHVRTEVEHGAVFEAAGLR